jgi:RNA polymerase sigma-70 factor, ECF subfamily
LDGEQLVGEFFDRVSGYVRMRIPGKDCEDVVGDIFLKAIERRDQVRGDVAAWLFSVARTRVADYYRRREAEMKATAERKVREESRAAGTAGNSPLERLSHAEFRKLLRVKMNQLLSEPERDAIAFKFTDGLSNVQIAEILGITPNRLGVLLHRALRRLRGAMLEEVPDVIPGRV